MSQLLITVLALAVGIDSGTPATGDATIRAQAGPSEIVITTTARLAGAIHSLTWNGKEFIDSYDHGRQLQSAANFDCDGHFIPEIFNPTEAGSMADGTGDRSSSKLRCLSTNGPELRTTTQMAFWLAPGEKSGGQLACNDRVLSNHLLSKRVHIGDRGNPHIIAYEVTFTVPAAERHAVGQFEAVTGYMPPEFSRFLRYDRAAEALRPLDDGPGEQPSPVVLATESGSHAMGVFSPEASPGYGRFRFGPERVNKWNCVFRVRDPEGIRAGDYRYRTFIVVGTIEDVRSGFQCLHKAFK